MEKITPFDYHSDEANHGNYQFVPLKEVVDDLQFEFNQNGHYLEHTRRTSILYHAKECLRKYNKTVKNDPLAIEMTVPENLVIAMPHNYVDWLRVSVVVTDDNTDSYRLKPLDINTNMNIAIGYLQDHNAEILFDQSGGILQADATSVYAQPYKKYEFDNDAMGGQRELDTSKLSKYGEFAIDQKRGKIVFSSDLYDKEIVLEYISDGLEFDTYAEETIKVHKKVVEMVKDWVYLECVNPKRDVPANEKERARRRFMTTKHQVVMDRADLNMLEIARVMQSSSKHL